MNPTLACLSLLPLVLCQENWSPEEGNSSFEPSATVLEQWSEASDRTEKIMKKPDRYIMNRPPPPPPKEPAHEETKDKGVSETDLFLLGAIEKLAHRMEYLEKRLNRAEEILYQLVSGSQFNEKQDPCPENFRRFGGTCYHLSSKQVNWKSASSTCRSLNSALLEFDSGKEKKAFISSLQTDPYYDGKDFWTGGLNPGLLWIWSNSAKPVLTNSTQSGENKPIEGNGRCLLFKYHSPTKTYAYRGTDCSSRNFFICKFQENAVERKLERLQREFRFSNNTKNVSIP